MQAKDRAQQQLRQKVNSVNCTMCHVTRGSPEEQLRSSEAVVADFQKALQQRDPQPQGTKVSSE